MWRIIMLCVVTMDIAAVGKVSYEGYKLLRIHVPKTDTHLAKLTDLKNISNAECNYWREPTSINKGQLLVVSPDKLERIYKTLNKLNVTFEIRIDNVQKLIDDSTNPKSQGFDFKHYHTLEEIYDNLEELAKTYPDKVQVVVGGTTYERREIKGVKIISGEEKPGIFIEGGIHAREWISPATVMYILHQILTSNDSNVRYIADSHNWFIFPVFNPDGYVFSHVEDRYWRKTRKPSSDTCIGSDPNRNWDFHWNTTGTSSDPCAGNYPGSEPFSEIEMRSMSLYIKSIRNSFYAYISFHSFSQELLFPYGYTAARISHYAELYRIGEIAIKALKQRYATQYLLGRIGKNKGKASGLSVDYIAGVFDKTIIYVYELRDCGNKYGFLLPPEQIIPTGEETLDSLIALLNATLSSGHAQNN